MFCSRRLHPFQPSDISLIVFDQPVYACEFVWCLTSLEVAMVPLRMMVVVEHGWLPFSRRDIGKPVPDTFGGLSSFWHSPDRHLQNIALLIDHLLAQDRLCRHIRYLTPYMGFCQEYR